MRKRFSEKRREPCFALFYIRLSPFRSGRIAIDGNQRIERPILVRLCTEGMIYWLSSGATRVRDRRKGILQKMGRLFTLADMAVLALCLLVLAPAAPSLQDDAPSPAPIRYVRTLGPFPIEGHEFSVKLNVICYKESQHEGVCDEDDEETVSSVRIADENGKIRFSKSFPVALVHEAGRHLVDVTLLEAHEHQALELTYEDLPSPPRTGESIQLFGLRNGTLKPIDLEPLEFHGGLADLPAGQLKNSKRLLENDTLRINVLTNYFYIVTPVRVNWKDFRLEQQDSGDFDVANQPPFQIHPVIQSERLIHMYPSPDKKTTPVGVNVTPQSRVQLLKARFSAAPPDEHDSANDTWLNIRIDGQEGWILGVDDYTALGLSFAR